MFFDGVNEVFEMFKNSFPLSFLFFVPIFILISPVSRTAAAHDFSVYRMQQYDLQGVYHGCRSALLNVEARSMGSVSFTRKCVIVRLKELTMEKYKGLVQSNAGGLIVLLPPDLANSTQEMKEHVLELEQDLMEEETQIPVFFTFETSELLSIYSDVTGSVSADNAGSAAEALLSSATSNGFQFVVSGAQQKALSDFQLVNIQGKLAGYGVEEQLPTIVVVAHYDAYGVAPSLSFGGDSNGSGVAALLELSRLFSRLYANSRTHAKYNLLFLLSAAGKFNYLGSRRWLEDQIESGDGGLLSDVVYVVCLDSIGSGQTLHAHVSKPPKPGSATDHLVQNLEGLLGEVRPGTEFSMVHKKINLADEYLAWEHERFSIRRLPALTISHLNSHKDNTRATVLDTRSNVDMKTLVSNTKIIAESLARQLYNLPSDTHADLFEGSLAVNEDLMTSWMDHLTSQPRGAQLLDKDHRLLSSLEQHLAKHVKDVRRHTFKPDKRDPEVTFYSGSEYIMNAYSVKPAVFDLFLAVSIGVYLTIVYFVMQNFHIVYSTMKKLYSGSAVPAKKVQ